MLSKLKHSLCILLFFGFSVSCIQNTLRLFNDEFQLLEISVEDSSDTEDDSEAQKKMSGDDDLFSQINEACGIHYAEDQVFRTEEHSMYFSFISLVSTPPPRHV